MNLTQFYHRWPAKQGRLFLFAGRPDHDRLAVFYTVCDAWRKNVNQLDFIRLHEPNITQLLEACRMDPVVSKHRVVAACDLKWVDPDEIEDREERTKAKRSWTAFSTFLKSFPKDLVLIISTAHDNPLTKNDVAQPIINKGFWVVLKSTSHDDACKMLAYISGWTDEQIINDVVGQVGTSASDLIQFLKVLYLSGYDTTPANIKSFLKASNTNGSVFDVVDAIIMRDLPRALSYPNVPAGQLIGALDRKLTSLVSFMAELRKGRSPKEAMIVLRLPGFIVHGLFEASKRWHTAEILATFPLLAQHTAVANNPGANDVLIRKLIG